MARWEHNQIASIPDWFWEAIETESNANLVEVKGCDVLYREWPSKSAKKDILLIHGMNAHSRWWDFIAPQLTDEYRVVAMDLTGMGDSDFRYDYSADMYVDEIVGVCKHAKLSKNVTLVGHSFGGRMAAKAASMHPRRFGSLVLVDSGMHHPGEPVREIPMMGGGRLKVYPDRRTAESRFRLHPPQPCENTFLLEYIAKHSLMQLDGGGYTWKFDEELPYHLENAEASCEDYMSLEMPVAILYGDNSESYTPCSNDYTVSLIPGAVRSSSIANAGHHVFLDQPLQFVDELKESVSWLHQQL